MKRSNAAARDLWAQVFEKAAKEPDAALHDHDDDAEAVRNEMIVQALREAGWSDTEIEKREGAKDFHGDPESINSPGVGPGLEFKLTTLSDRVRKAIAETGEISHEKVEIGIDPKVGVSASLTNVIMTDEGILSVSAFLFRWCGLIAKAYARTLYADLAHWTSRTWDLRQDRSVLLESPDLVLYWIRIFVSFSSTGTHIMVPYRPATTTEFHLFEQVAWAMEYFTVAHEFGHHVLSHRNVDDNPKAQEFQADTFAAKVCERLEFEPFPLLSNPYTKTGAGGSMMLLSLEILRSFEERTYRDITANDAHPTAYERIGKMSMRNLVQPKQHKMDQEFNGTVCRIMDAVAVVMRDFRNAGGDKLVAKIST